MFAYIVKNGRYVQEFIGDEYPLDAYVFETQIDCTKYMPDSNGEPIPIPVPEPTPEPVAYVPTAADRQASLVNAVQGVLDGAARVKGYDNIVSAVSYAAFDSVPQFQNEAVALGAWRSDCWAFCYDHLAKVQAGTIAEPTAAELLAMLPTSPFVVYGNDSVIMGNDAI